MTPLEDMIRWAIRAKADEFPPEAVPPLRLAARRRNSFSLAYGGREREGASARRSWRSWLAPAVCVILIAAVAAGSVALSHVMHGKQASGRHKQAAAASQEKAATAPWNQAVTWVAAQVSRAAVVSCDRMMCRALQAHGIPAGELEVLRPGDGDPFGSAVIVATAAVRSEFGRRLSTVYAPDVIAAFGAGSARIDVRVIAPGGAAAYRSALRADRTARREAGTQLLRNKLIRVSATARTQLSAGQVDSRLLITIAAMAARHPVSVVAFGDSGPGAGAGTPLRSADLARADRAAMPGSAYFHVLSRFLRAQPSTFHPAQVGMLRLPGGQPVLRVEYTAPSPLGLLTPPRKIGT